MLLTVDLDNSRLLDAYGQPVTAIDHRYGGDVEIRIKFQRGGTFIEPASVGLIYTVKTFGKFDQDPPLALTSTFAKEGTGSDAVWIGSAAIYGPAIADLLLVDGTDTNDAPTAAAMSEVYYTIPGASDHLPKLTTTISNSLYRGTESTPILPPPGAQSPSYLPLVTGHTGGTATDLDGQPTAGVSTPRLYEIVVDSIWYSYQLRARTEADVVDGITIIDPVDSDPDTNNKVFENVTARDGGAVQVADKASAGNLTAGALNKWLDAAVAKDEMDTRDAANRDRANGTGTQLAGTISDFSTAADARIAAAVGTSVQAWSGNLDTFASYNPATLPVSTAQASADSAVLAAALASSAPVFTLEMFGGSPSVLNNATAFQVAVDAAQAVGGTVLLGPGRYSLHGPQISITKPVKIVGCAATILDGKYLLASGNGDGGLYYDSYISISSPVDSGVTVKTFSGAVTIGTKSFTLNNVTGLSVDDFVWFQMGPDPTDSNEEQVRFIDQITGISGNVVTVKTGLTEPIASGSHKCTRLLSVARNVSIENVSVDYLGINVFRAEDVRVSDIKVIEGTATFTIAEFDGLTIERVTADYIHGVNGPNGLPWYGWFIQGWGMRNLRVSDMIVRKLECLSFFSCESQSRNVDIENIQLGVIGTGPQQCVPFSCLVDLEQPISVRNLTLTLLDTSILYPSGPVFHFNNIAFNSSSGSGYLGLNLADHTGFLRFKNEVYSKPHHIRRVIRPGSSTSANYSLGTKGLLGSTRIYCSTTTGLNLLNHYNGAGSSPDFAPSLVAGSFVDYYDASDIGGPNQFTDDREVRIETGSSWPATGIIIVEADILMKPIASPESAEVIRGSGDPSASAAMIGQEYYDYTNLRFWKSENVGTGSSDWAPLFTSLVNATLTNPTVINGVSVNDANTSGVTRLMQNGANTLFGSSFGTYSGALMLGSNNGHHVGIVKADLGGGDMVFGKGLFGAFTEWARFIDGTGVFELPLGLRVGAGAVMKKVVSASATLDFPSILAVGGVQDLTITVTGSAVGDSVALGLPASPDAGVTFDAWVSSANTVTIRATNYTAAPIDPASASYRATIFNF